MDLEERLLNGILGVGQVAEVIEGDALQAGGEAAFSTWLYRILINTCYDMMRRRRRRVTEAPIDDALSATRAASNIDDAKRLTLTKLVGELPEQRRSVFVLFEVEGLSHADIASILDISEANSKWILFSTKKQLQQQWKRQTQS